MSSAATISENSMPAVGAAAPAFDLPTGSGQRTSLAALKGKKVVLYFYPKDDTSGCTREAQDFTTLKDSFTATGTEIIGISPDNIASKAKFAKKHSLDVTLAADEDRRVVEAYGVWVEKSMYGRTYMGVERTTFLIDRDGRIAEVWQKVKVPGHAAVVLEAARAI